jgi:uncharacterized protein with GYD domain
MAMMLTLAKFSSSGAQGTLSDGLVKREEQNREAVEKAGGRLIGYYAVAEGEWDMVTLVETPADFDAAAAARANQFFTSSGAYERVRSYRIVTAQEFDAGQKTLEETYRPPGT